MKKVSAVLVLAVFACLLFTTVVYANTTVTIFHTNDIHGRFVHRSAPGFNANAIGIDTVAAILESADNAILVDAGDTFHGVPFVNLGRGRNAVELMNVAGYSLFAPGNHDFNFGTERLLELEELANFGFISANVFWADGSGLVFDAYRIIEVGGINLGFFGLTTPDTPIVTHPDNVANLYFGDPVSASAQAVAALREAGADIVIALAHLGLDGDINSVTVATAVPGIDIFIDGHSHDLLPRGAGVEGTDTLIVQAGGHGENLGRVDIIREGDGFTIGAYVIGQEYAHENFEPHPATAALIAEMLEEMDAALGEVVGYTPVELVGDRVLIRTMEMPLGNLVANSMAWASGAQLALANSGGIRDSFAAGELTVGDIITVLTFPNFVVVLEITPAQLWEALEGGVSQWPADAGRFPQIYGFSFTFDGYAEPGSRVLSITIDGAELDPNDNDTVFTLATNDFMAAGGDGYAVFMDLPRVSEAGIMSDVFTDFLSVADLHTGVEGRIVQAGPRSPLYAVPRHDKDGVPFVLLSDVIAAYGVTHIAWDANRNMLTLTDNDGYRWRFIIDNPGIFLDTSIWQVYVNFDVISELAD